MLKGSGGVPAKPNRHPKWTRRIWFERKTPKYDYRGPNGVFLYALIDPRDQTVRYVGMTRNLEARLRGHCKTDTTNPLLRNWIRSLISKELRPEMHRLGRAAPNQWERAERRWIGFFRNKGRIYNIANGGALPKDRESSLEAVEQRRLRRLRERPNDPSLVGRIDAFGKYHRNVRDDLSISDRVRRGPKKSVKSFGGSNQKSISDSTPKPKTSKPNSKRTQPTTCGMQRFQPKFREIEHEPIVAMTTPRKHPKRWCSRCGGRIYSELTAQVVLGKLVCVVCQIRASRRGTKSEIDFGSSSDIVWA